MSPYILNLLTHDLTYLEPKGGGEAAAPAKGREETGQAVSPSGNAEVEGYPAVEFMAGKTGPPDESPADSEY